MKFIPNAMSVKFARQALIGQKHSPAFLFAVGVAGVGCSTVLACRATLRLEETMTAAKNDLDMARALDHEEYTEADRKHDTALIYTRSVVEVAKLYAPAVILGAASIGALTASHTILTRRNVALTAAYAAIEKGFSDYRRRVVDKYGEQQDREFRYSTEVVEITNEKGKKEKVTRVAPDAESIYARFFDPLSPSWNKEPEYNLVYLRSQQNYCNDLLKTRGHVFLNEVYAMLGIPHSGAGAVVGWIVGGDGDNFIDFGIFVDNEGCRDFVNGREGSILLDFNVDGIIWDKIDDHKRGELGWQS